MKLSFVCTVYNEEDSIQDLLKSIFNQTPKIDEIIIVDGGSTDKTLLVISNFIASSSSDQEFLISNKTIKVFTKKGNRSVGRNFGITKAVNSIILLSDAGCILDKNWVKYISEPFRDQSIDVVAGYYQGNAKTNFQKALVPYVLVMPNKVNPKLFLPATRSMAIKKSVWQKVGKFNEKFSHNEDYEFAKRLQKLGVNIFFQKKAIVNWTPCSNILSTSRMFYRFAYGDIEAKIFRPKVLFLFLRYFLGLLWLLMAIIFHQFLLLCFLFLGFLIYIVWSITKNYQYVKKTQAFYYLLLLQLISDIAVLLGSTFALSQLLRNKFKR